MSAHWLKKLVLVAALAVMPLQGVTAGLAVLLCHGDAQTHATHEDSSHDHGSKQSGHHDDGGNVPGSYHLCCHYTVTAPSTATPPAALPDFPVRTFTANSLHDLFVPEQPQRPPLA